MPALNILESNESPPSSVTGDWSDGGTQTDGDNGADAYAPGQSTDTEEEYPNAGVNQFMEKYPNVKVEVVAAGTGELCNRIAAETANPIADVLWGGGADSLAAFKEYFQPYVRCV